MGPCSLQQVGITLDEHETFWMIQLNPMLANVSPNTTQAVSFGVVYGFQRCVERFLSIHQ
jgi:hypothetical protein